MTCDPGALSFNYGARRYGGFHRIFYSLSSSFLGSWSIDYFGSLIYQFLLFRHGEWHKELILSLAATYLKLLNESIQNWTSWWKTTWSVSWSFGNCLFSFFSSCARLYPLSRLLADCFILSLPYVKRYLFFRRVNFYFQASALYIPTCSAFSLGYIERHLAMR